MRTRMNYWSCSKLADWIRGTPKLDSATSKSWQDWKINAKNKSPVRFWIAEEGLDRIQNFVNFIPDQLNSVRYYINNRWVSRSHALTAHPRNIKPGTWCDVGNRFLPCLFNELVDFVEIEQAWHHCVFSEEDRKKYNVPWWRSGWLRWRTWRCPEAGIAYLMWAGNLKWTKEEGFEENDPHIGQLTPQAIAAREILELYTWWTKVYPLRPDVHDASGWSAYCDKKREVLGEDSILCEDDTDELKEMCTTSLAKLQEIEKAYEEEDEARARCS